MKFAEQEDGLVGIIVNLQNTMRKFLKESYKDLKIRWTLVRQIIKELNLF